MEGCRLAVTDLACRRGDRVLFRGLSFELNAGEALQVAGPNGTGKSSLLRIVAGLLRPFPGTVERKCEVALLDEPQQRAPCVVPRYAIRERHGQRMAVGILNHERLEPRRVAHRRRIALVRLDDVQRVVVVPQRSDQLILRGRPQPQEPRRLDRRVVQEIERGLELVGIAHLQAVRLERSPHEQRIADRAEARKQKNFAEADRVRDELKQLGVEIMDTPAGTTWKVLP